MAENDGRAIEKEIKSILKRKREDSKEGGNDDDNPIRSILKKTKPAKPKSSKSNDVSESQLYAERLAEKPKGILKSTINVPTKEVGHFKSILKTPSLYDDIDVTKHDVTQKDSDSTLVKAIKQEKEDNDSTRSKSSQKQPDSSIADKKQLLKESTSHPKQPKATESEHDKRKDSKRHSSHKKSRSPDRKSSKRSKVKEEKVQPVVEDEEDDDDDIVAVQDPKVDRSRSCPYLDTINRSVLDFDFEKLCSVSLSHINVYACLVCGKYFQGRGKMSHAYTHSVQDSHHVYLNLLTHKFYCLPDNYQIVDSSLEDIIYVLNPTFSTEHIRRLDTVNKLSRAYDGTTYQPGIVGLNNIKANDYCNVILQSLSHVSPLRNYFLQEESYKKIKRPPGDQIFLIVQRFGELLRKLWNPRNFKAHVSPHEMLQAVVLCSKKRFQITQQGDAVEFMSWFLNTLHTALNGTRKLSSSIINKTFRGKMKVYTHKVLPVELKDEEKEKLLLTEEFQETVEEMPWLYLTCDLPAPPLYPDELRENIIPQVPFATILAKFNGINEKEYKTHKDSTMKRFELTRLPPYIIVYIKRFTKNYFLQEKNRTIVNFPIKNIDFGDLLSPEIRAQHKHTTYDLMANIVHDGEPGSGKGTYRVHVMHKGTGKWNEMQDLHVTDILPQMITLSESYIQIFELRRDIPNPTFGQNVVQEDGGITTPTVAMETQKD